MKAFLTVGELKKLLENYPDDYAVFSEYKDSTDGYSESRMTLAVGISEGCGSESDDDDDVEKIGGRFISFYDDEVDAMHEEI